MVRPGGLALLCALTAALTGAVAPASAASRNAPPAAPSGARVVLAFLPTPELSPNVPRSVKKNRPSIAEIMLARLTARPQLAIGLVSPTQGAYSPAQALLDITSGNRVSNSTYDPHDPAVLKLRRLGAGGVFAGWHANVKRADSAPATVHLGLLASAIPGGAGYVGVDGQNHVYAVPAADRGGRVAALSLGSAASVPARAQALLRRHRLVVVNLPEGSLGDRQLATLLADRGPRDLVVAMQAPPQFRGSQLLPIGIAGLGSAGALASDTTRRRGIIAGIDMTKTFLRQLGLKVPGDVTGEPIRVDGPRNVAAVNKLRKRFGVIPRRRLPSLQAMLLAWVGLMFALGAYGGWHRTRRLGLRIGALAMMWAPAMVLVTAALAPRRAVVEMAVLALGCFGLAVLTDRLLPWPRGPLLPAAVGLTAITVDLANDSNLIVRSLLGSNPRFGARFFGVGNELEPALAVLLFAGLAAAIGWRARSRERAAAFAAAGLALGVVIGWGRLGADVGGVLTVAGGTAVATLLMLPGGPTRRAIGLAVLAPLAALGALAALDLATGGNGHFTRSVLHGQSGESLKDVFVRRYDLAFHSFVRGRMPAVVLAGALAVTFAYRNRTWLYAPLRGAPAWQAAMVGGLAAGVVGSLGNDSGPLLFVVAVFALAIITAYVQGDPRLAADAGGEELRGGLRRDRLARGPSDDPIDGRPSGVEPPVPVPSAVGTQ